MRYSSCLVVRRGGVVGDLLGEGDGRPGAAGAHAAPRRQARVDSGGGVGIGGRSDGGQGRRRLRGGPAEEARLT